MWFIAASFLFLVFTPSHHSELWTHYRARSHHLAILIVLEMNVWPKHVHENSTKSVCWNFKEKYLPLRNIISWRPGNSCYHHMERALSKDKTEGNRIEREKFLMAFLKPRSNCVWSQSLRFLVECKSLSYL